MHPSPYRIAGKTLLWTFERTLGDEFTPEARDGWKAVYEGLASVTQESATEAKTGTAAAAA